MSWYLEDKNGYMGDFGTHGGIKVMLGRNLPNLHELIESEVADDALRNKIVDELNGKAEFTYIRDMLLKGEPPLHLSDGVEVE